ncbi:extracellular solute-binding protein [Halegenticoccus soli]|uniref:extracellular solute-binding protein n=1 Tax=Halegenticoccus soli TaxID=1985678 RepID=UPI000C6CD488|nr:extracellular solute-binding protein [Halegenticoccus soli]
MDGGNLRRGRSERGSAADRRVSRREFVKAAGATGAAVGVAGCTALGSGTDANTVQWLADSNVTGAASDVREGLYEAGLSRDVSLEILAGPSSTDARQQQIQRWLDAGLSNPDLIMTDSGWTIPFIVRQQLVNFTGNPAVPDRLVERIENQYFESIVQTAKHPQTGDLYGMPLFLDVPTMLYRRDLIEEAGYSPKRENWASESIRWKRFARAVRDALDRNRDLQYGFTFQAAAYEGLSCCDFNEFMSSFGGAYFGGRDTLFGPVGERPVTVNTQPVIDSIRMIRTFIGGPDDPHALDGYAGPISPRAVLSWIEDSSLAPFTNGNAVAHRNWPYAIPISREALGNKLGVMPIPYAVTERQSRYRNIGGPVASLGGWHVTINPHTEKLDRAVEVLRAMATRSFRLTLLNVIGWLPPEPKLLDSRASRELLGDAVEPLRVAGENAIPRPVTVVWPQESTKIAQIVNDTYGGGIAPAEAMRTLQSQLVEIENYNG